MNATFLILSILPANHDSDARTALALASRPVMVRPAQVRVSCSCGPACDCPAGVCPSCPRPRIRPAVRTLSAPPVMHQPMYFQPSFQPTMAGQSLMSPCGPGGCSPSFGRPFGGFQGMPMMQGFGGFGGFQGGFQGGGCGPGGCR